MRAQKQAKETKNMSRTIEKCEICGKREATVFMVVREGGAVGKGYVCLCCFEGAQAAVGDCAESVSLPEYREAEGSYRYVTPA